MTSIYNTEAAEILDQESPKLLADLKTVNGRLKQPIEPYEVLSALRICANLGMGACVLLQPGHSGYAWSDRSIPLVFIAHLGETLRVRVRRGHSRRNSVVTPAIWPELRGFPRGDSSDKIARWAGAEDGGDIALRAAKEQSISESYCYLMKWTPVADGTYAMVA